MNSKKPTLPLLQSFLLISSFFLSVSSDCSSSSNNQTFVISNNQQVLFQVNGNTQTVSVNNSRLFVNGIDVNDFLQLHMKKPMVSVTHSTTQSIPAPSPTNGVLVLFDTDLYITNSSMHSLADSSKLYAPMNGVYLISGIINWDGIVEASLRRHTLYKNGVLLMEVSGATLPSFWMTSFSEMVSLQAGDYVQLYAKSEVNTSLRANGSRNTFSLSWMNP